MRLIIGMLLACIITAGMAVAAGAQDEHELEPVVVVGNPILQENRVDRNGSVTTVVGQEQVERLGAMDVSDALRRTPGVTITRYNQVGSFGGAEGGAVFIRGMGSSRPGSEIKTYVDGIPLYMGPWNHPLLDLLPVDLAGSIEVIKGPQPQTVGNTLSAINIVPKVHEDEGFDTSVSASGGSWGTFAQSAQHGGRVGGFDYLVGDGFRISDGHRDNADGRLTSGYANLGLKLTDAWSARMLGLIMDNYADDPGPDVDGGESEGRYETRARLAALTLKNDYGWADGEIKVFASAGVGEWSEELGDVDVNENEFWFYGIHAKEILRLWEGGEILLGLDQEWWDAIVSYDYDDGSEDTQLVPEFTLTMPYVSLSHTFGEQEDWHITPSVGARYYSHNKFDDEVAPFAGIVAGYADTEVFASASRGVVYPGLDVVILFAGSDWTDLEAEETTHLEVGMRHTFSDKVKAEVTVFQDDGDNRYSFTIPPYPPVWGNTENYDIRGMEAMIQIAPSAGLSMYAGLTVLDSEPADMPYVPDTMFSTGFNWRFLEHFVLSADCEYVADMYALKQVRRTGITNTEKVDEHLLVNARLGWEFALESLGADGELFLQVRNLTDEDYEYQPDYPMPGINGMVGVNFSF